MVLRLVEDRQMYGSLRPLGLVRNAPGKTTWVYVPHNAIGGEGQTCPHSTLTGTLWRGSTPSISWEPTYWMTPPGLPTPQQLSRRHSSGYTSWECPRKTTWSVNWWWPFTAPPSKEDWCTAFWRGTPAALRHQTREPSKESSTQPNKSLAAHCPPCKTLPAPATSAGPKILSKSHHTQATTCLISCPLVDGKGPLGQGPRV